MKKLLVLIVAMMGVLAVQGQVPIKVSTQVVDRNGKHCWLHILEKGQTVFSIARAYGIKEYEAITSKDIHHLSVGDTVWLPCKNPNQPLSSGKEAEAKTNEAMVDETNASENNIKVEPGQTLYGISRTYGVTIEDILALNPEVESNGLKAGQMLRLPQKGNSTSSKQEKVGAKTSSKTSTSTATGSQITYRGRVDKDRIHVSLMMPLYLNHMDEISTTKFDIEQRGRTTYKSLEFIQFYEGIQMGLEEVKKMGYDVVLNVVDVSGNSESLVEQEFNSHQVAHSDVLVTLLMREPFAKAAELAKKNNLFIINPLAKRGDILSNPYVVKCMPSVASQVNTILDDLEKNHSTAHLTILHSNGSQEKEVREELLSQLKERGNIAYTLFDWNSSSKLVNTLKKNKDNVVLNIYNQGRSRNRIQVSNMLNRLSAMKDNPAILYSLDDYTQEYSDVDFHQLQHVSYHTFNYDYDLENPKQKAFVEAYREQYKTEPMGQYAQLGHDIIIYFVNGLHKSGDDFWKNPATGNPPAMIRPFHLRQSQAGYGYENQNSAIYQMGNYRFERVNTKK